VSVSRMSPGWRGRERRVFITAVTARCNRHRGPKHGLQRPGQFQAFARGANARYEGEYKGGPAPAQSLPPARRQTETAMSRLQESGPFGTTVDPAEIGQFSRLGAQWWDERGPMATLHKFNPVRVGYIRDQAALHFNRDPKAAGPLKGLRILDIGCGGGILSEPLARLGAKMTGADPSEDNIAVAEGHAARMDIAIDYRATTAEALADAGERFDVVLAMEVVEHVTDMPLFVRRCGEMVKPGGLMIAATLNRTLKSFALAIVGAEYVLRWLPRGTHRFDKFVTPTELEDAMSAAGLRLVDERGVVYSLLSDNWQLSSDMDVNYMLTAAKPA
jgi:2-polyprenyl-6-hydroxyphenyl methylase/3-demethylubiquinone-9 3-methyltransferase